MDTFTPQQKKMLLDWANICNEKKQIDIYFSLTLEHQDNIAIIGSNIKRRTERIDFASGLELGKVLKSFVDLKIIKFIGGTPLIQCGGFPYQVDHFLYQFTSENAPNELILKLQNI